MIIIISSSSSIIISSSNGHGADDHAAGGAHTPESELIWTGIWHRAARTRCIVHMQTTWCTCHVMLRSEHAGHCERVYRRLLFSDGYWYYIWGLSLLSPCWTAPFNEAACLMTYPSGSVWWVLSCYCYYYYYYCNTLVLSLVTCSWLVLVLLLLLRMCSISWHCMGAHQPRNATVLHSLMRRLAHRTQEAGVLS